MTWSPLYRQLRQVLASLFGDPGVIRTMAADLGLTLGQINFAQPSEIIWQQIIELCDAQQDVVNLVLIAKDLRPRNKDLASIYECLSPEGESKKAVTDWKSPTLSNVDLEKLMGDMPTFLPVAFLLAGWEAAKSVVRVRTATDFGTGFLIENNMLLTNNHVIPDKNIARDTELDFDYEVDIAGTTLKHFSVPIDQTIFFTDADVDLTAVGIKLPPGFSRAALCLGKERPKLKDRVSIIQHPEGGRKRVALQRNIVLYSDPKVLQYLTDTLPGSSGSPIFDNNWKVVGIHHSGGNVTEPGTNQLVYRNQGAALDAIRDCLRRWGLIPND